MLKILFFATILVVVIGDELTDKLNEKMSGDWTPVKIFPPTPIKRHPVCQATNNTVLDDYCKCDGKLAPQLKRSNALLTNQLPIIIVETEEELNEGYNATCLCKEQDETSEEFGELIPTNHMMIRFVSDNYFVAYDKGYRARERNAYALILAKELPTTEELEQLITKIDFITNEEGTIICTKDKQAETATTADTQPNWLGIVAASTAMDLRLLAVFSSLTSQIKNLIG